MDGPFVAWVVPTVAVTPGCRVAELGAGTGGQYVKHCCEHCDELDLSAVKT